MQSRTVEQIVRLTQEEIVLNLRAILPERAQQRTAARVPVIMQREVPAAQKEQTTVDVPQGEVFCSCSRDVNASSADRPKGRGDPTGATSRQGCRHAFCGATQAPMVIGDASRQRVGP